MILEGKSALVTGAGHGLGRAIALAYAKYGAKVVVNDINDVSGAETVALIEKAGAAADYLHADVTSPGQFQEMIDGVTQSRTFLCTPDGSSAHLLVGTESAICAS